MSNLTDPIKNPKGVKSGSKAKLTRDAKGNLKSIKEKDFGGITKESIEEGAAMATAANKGPKDFGGGAAPRVGGFFKTSSPSASGTKKKILMKKSIKMAKNSSASPQAKKAAIRQLKMRK